MPSPRIFRTRTLTRLWPRPADGITGPSGLFAEPPLARGYDEPDLTTWFDAFVAPLPQSARILDLAAGTTAVTLAVQRAADRRALTATVEMIDPGEPESAAAAAGGRTPPQLAEGAFDGVVSMFGFERFDAQLALPWLRRILAPGGIVNCLILALESPMARDGLDYIDVFDAVIRPWWRDTRLAVVSGATADVAMRTGAAEEQLKLETHREPIRDALASEIHRLSSLAAAAPESMAGAWERLDRHTELLRARMSRALDAGAARQLVRDAELAGLDDTCVVPFELEGWLFGWHWTAARRSR